MLSHCFTTYNRDTLLFEAIEGLLDDPKADEIIIVDDFSDYEFFKNVMEKCRELDLRRDSADRPKIKLHRNHENYGMSRNKAKAIRVAKNDWVSILDSDNKFDKTFLAALPSRLNSDTIYCPAFAKKDFDYRKYAGMTLDRTNLKPILKSGEPMINCFLNTCNYVVHRESYLKTYKFNEEHVASDTIWFNYNWLANGGKFYIVPTMEYIHRVHDGSGFKNNIDYNMRKADEVRKLILSL